MNRREAEELLPWFVNGTLDEEESQAVQAFIDSGEITPEELAGLEAFAETVAERGAEEAAYDPAILKRAMSQLDGVTQDAPPEPLVVGESGRSLTGGASDAGSRPTEQPPGLIERIGNFLQWSATPPLARALVAAQFALLLGLVVLVAGRGEVEEAAEVVSETVAGSPSAQTADFTLSFAPGAGEAEIRSLLVTHGVSIVAGPSALGIYHVAGPADADRAELAGILAASPLVTFLQQVPQP